MTMDCTEFDDLLPAYALSALSAGEMERAGRHLASCRRHDAELAALARVREALAEDAQPSPALRARLLDAFDSEAGGAPRDAARVVALPWWRRAQTVWPATAAALLVVAIALAAWNVVLQQDGEQTRIVAQLEASSGSGRVVYLPDETLAVLETDLPALPAGRAYQAWRIDASGAASLGLVPEQGVVAFRADLEGADAVAVSEEPAGGSEQPTSEPLAVAPLP